MGAGAPKLSVIIGSNNARETIGECLTALQTQQNGRNLEIVVVDNSTDGTPEIISREFPQLTMIRKLESSLMPELWEAGINHSSGEIVAITTAHFIAHEKWIQEILKAHESPSPGIGGAIENAEGSGLVQWAIYFCRYSPYMLPFSKMTVYDFAGDNASYKRWALDRCKAIRISGFWEPSIHAELIKDGHQLLVSPDIIVFHRKSFSWAGFMKQRFWHGRQFGSDRASKISGLKRLTYILLSPVIPALFLTRITRRILEKERHLREYLLSLPIVFSFLVSWSVGELSGYLWISKKGDEPPSH